MQYGMVPYYIDTYVKKLGVLTLEEAINRTSFLPAQEVLNMKDRGLIALNAFADLVVFNFDEIAMGGITGVPDYEHPNVPPNGIQYAFVNGKLTFKDKAFTGVKAGKVLRKNAQNRKNKAGCQLIERRIFRPLLWSILFLLRIDSRGDSREMFIPDLRLRTSPPLPEGTEDKDASPREGEIADIGADFD
jgi:hypothetical protein